MPEAGDYQPQAAQQQFGERSGSPNTDWQSIARTKNIEEAALSLGIPERSWNHPTVHAFVETTLNANTVQSRFAQTIESPFLKEQNVAYHQLSLHPTLYERYYDSAMCMKGVMQILEYGLPPSTPSQKENVSRYIANKIEPVTERFGILVTRMPEAETHVPNEQPPVALPGSAWADWKPAPQPDLYARYAARYGSQNYDRYATNWHKEQTQTEEQTRVRVLATASRLGIPEQNLDHAIVREFVDNLHEIEDLLAVMEQGEAPPGAPGLTPSVTQRYTMGAHVLTVVKALMEEGFQGRTVDPQFVATRLTSALAYYDLQARLQIEG